MRDFGGEFLISIRKTTNELDRMDELLHAISDTYGHAVRSTAQYAIELDPADTSAFRAHILGLQRQVEAATVPEDWKSVQASFRGELRDFRDRSAGRLAHLRAEVKAAGEAVQVFAESVSASDTDHEVQIKESLGQLEVISRSVNPQEMQRGIHQATGSINGSIAVMRRSHQVAIAQLRDEIRLLHHQIDVERNAHLIDRATGVWNRQKLDSHVSGLLQTTQPFCVLLVCVRNLPLLGNRYSRTIIEGSLKALLQRFAAMLEERTVIGRWDEQNFAAILEMEPAAAIGVSRNAAHKLSGEYSVQENGLSQNVPLQAVAGVIDRSVRGDETSFQQKLLQMSQALTAA